MKRKILMVLGIILLVGTVSANLYSEDNLYGQKVTNITITNIVVEDTNSTNFWDALDSPSDILGSLINNDLSWINLSDVLIYDYYNSTDFNISDYLLNSGDTATGNYTFNGNGTFDFLFGDGSQLRGISASPGGSTTEVQFNDNGVFGGNSTFTWDSANDRLSLFSPLATAGGSIHIKGNDGNTGTVLRLEEGQAGGSEFFDMRIDTIGDLLFVDDVGATKFAISDAASEVGIKQKLVHLADTDTFLNFFADELVFEIGGSEMIRLKEATASLITFNDDGRVQHLRVEADTNQNIFYIDGTGNGLVGIGTSTPAFPLEVWGNGANNVSIWAEGNISAGGYITRTSVFDKSKPVWDYIRDSDYFLTNSKIDHTKFYGYTTYLATDYSRPEWVNTSYFDVDENNKTIYFEGGHIGYPNKYMEEGVLLDAEVELLRQGIFELKQENDLMKQDLCYLKILRWC